MSALLWLLMAGFCSLATRGTVAASTARPGKKDRGSDEHRGNQNVGRSI